MTEGDTGTPSATFTVTPVAGQRPARVTVDYATADGTATRPADYPARERHAHLRPGPDHQTVTVPSTATRSTRRTRRSSSTCQRRPTPRSPTARARHDHRRRRLPTLSINDVTVTEGNAGTTTPTFTVSCQRASGQTVTVDYATANGTATAPADYRPTSGTLDLRRRRDHARRSPSSSTATCSTSRRDVLRQPLRAPTNATHRRRPGPRARSPTTTRRRRSRSTT